MPRKKQDPTEPTWEEVVALQRDVKRLKAKVKVLEVDLRNADDALESQEKTAKERLSKNQSLRESNDKLRAHVNDLNFKVCNAQRNELELNRQMGELEVRLARALGRTYVVSHSDEMATLVGALAQVSDFAKLTLEKEYGGQGWSKRSDPVEARLRQVVTICEQAIGKMAKDGPSKDAKAVEHTESADQYAEKHPESRYD